MNNNGLLSALSLCRKAGALVTGFDPVKEAAFSGKAVLVLLTSDLSPKTALRVKRFCEDFVECADMNLTMEELSPITRKPAGVFAVTDDNLAKLCKGKLSVKKEEYDGN